jgi:hypothetical protein
LFANTPVVVLSGLQELTPLNGFVVTSTFQLK